MYPENQEVDTEIEDQEAFEQEARTMGWRPEEEYKGKAPWVDAETFVKRGREVLPIIAKNNKALKRQVDESHQKIDNLSTQLANANAAIEKLVKQNAEQARRSAMGIKTTLKAQLKEAREANDFDAEEEIRGQLREVDEIINKKDEEEPPKKNDNSNESELDPGVARWLKQNDWYQEDKKRAKQFDRLITDLRDGDDDESDRIEGLTGKELLDTVLEILEEREGSTRSKNKSTSKVETGAHRGGNNVSNGGGKGWASLPKEAKDAAMGFADDLVGEGKKYKDLKAWQTAYAKDYFGE